MTAIHSLLRSFSELIIGRGATDDGKKLTIDDRTVSREHVLLQVTRCGWPVALLCVKLTRVFFFDFARAS